MGGIIWCYELFPARWQLLVLDEYINCQYHAQHYVQSYQDTTGNTKLRTTQYSILENLVGHVALISLTTYFGNVKAMRTSRREYQRQLPKRATPPAVCEMSLGYDNETFIVFGPACLKIVYNINGYTPSVDSGSKITFDAFLN